MTDEHGQFSFPLLPPGEYDVSVAALGFKVYRANGIELQVAATVAVPVTLELGAVTESVTVVAAPRRIDASLATTVESKLIRGLPLPSRHALDVAAVAPGLDVLGGSGQVIGVDGGGVLAAGHRRSQNSFYLDGAENAGAWRNSALQVPNPDAIEAVEVRTANAGVQFGKQPGATLNFVTRSGTNELQGTLFYFGRDERLNANSWANNRNGLPKPADNQRFVGGVAGGPIRRQQTFFFVSLNRYDNNFPVTQQSGRFPTEAMKRGDFSEVPAFIRPDGTPVPFDIKDPVSGASLGTTIPVERQSAAARQLLQLLPTARRYYETAVRQFERPIVNVEYLAKVDQISGPSHRLSGLMMHTRGRELDPSQGFAANTVPAWGELRRLGRQTTAFLKHGWTITPSWMLESRFSVAQSSSDILPLDQTRGPQDVGIAFPWAPPIRQLPGVRLDAQGGFRADHATTDYVGQRNQRVGGTIIRARGRHRLTIGAETQVDMVRFEANRELRSLFAFNGRDSLNGPITSTQVPLAANNFGVQNFAYAWADFLMGRVASFSVAGYGRSESRFRSTYLFGEHAWHLQPSVTLTAGVRYEIAGDVAERYGQFGGLFVERHRSSRFPHAPVGLAWPGDAGLPAALLRRDLNNVAPQVGFSYDLSGSGRTVLRTAVGQFYSTIPLASRINVGTSGFGGGTIVGANALLDDPYRTSRINPDDLDPQYGPSRPLPDPMVGYTPSSFPWAALFTTQIVRGVPTPVFVGNLVGFDPAATTPSSLQFSASIERQLRRGWMVNAAYVGDRTHHQPMWRALNAPVPAAGADTSAQSLRDRRPHSEYGDGRVYSTILATQYDALQLSSMVRMPRLSAAASYVLARELSPFGVNASGSEMGDIFGFSTGSASADAIFDTATGAGQSTYPYDINRDRAEVGRRHTFTVHYLVDIPRLSHESGWAAVFLRDWAVSGVFMAASGLPLNVIWGLDANADGSVADRPSVVAPVHYPRTLVEATSFDRRGAIQYISPEAFVGPCGTMARTGPQAFCTTPGNLPRNAIRGVPVFSADLALARHVILGATRLELRLEGFNVTNSNFLGPPTLDLSSPFFGQVIGRTHRVRRMQVGVKLHF